MQTILIIEDNADYRANLAEVLQFELYHTLEAENGLIGLAMISDYLPDLIISDIDMPIMNGIGMLLSVKLDSKIAKIPFIFITGQGDELTQKHLKGLGADLCLAKSISMDDLINLIHDLLNT